MGTNREPFLKFEPQPDGAVLISFGGEWSIHRAIPAQEDLAKHLGAPSAAKSVRFDLSALQDWDSSLVSCVTSVAMRCRELKIPIDTEGAPDGVDRLLKMALAVPEQNTRPAPERELFFTRLGKAGITLGAAMIEVAAFAGLSVMAFGNFLRGRAVFRWSDTWVIIQRCGVEALAIVTLINFLIGVILGFVGGVQLEAFGATIYMATLVGIAMARELGCLMTGIIMSGRTGAAFAAEIGSMKSSQEIDALKTMGLSPMEFLVLPRMLAMLVMMPLLTIYGNVMGMIGGAVLAPGFDVTFHQYYNQLVASVDIPNYAVGVIKSVFFGAIIAGCGCLKGIQSGTSSAAVGQATTSAVVTSITCIIALDAVFAFVLTALGI
jgi:phospholipid/cholesterol/gamma-HCH transport system permease protein